MAPGAFPRIAAYEEIWDASEGVYVQKQIGSTGSIATNRAWEIPISDGYVAAIETIYFKIISKAAGQVDQEYTLSSSIYNLTGTSETTLSVPLFKLNNVRVESNLTSVTILWDDAAWASGGFKIYRYNGTDYVLINSPVRGATSYTDTVAAGVYGYKITGVYGSPATEGEEVYFTAISGIAAPQNVTAVTAANCDYPFRTTISWDPVADAEWYDVYRNGTYIGNSGGPSYSDTSSKTIGETYTYYVVAYNSTSGTSANSATAAVSFPVTVTLPLGSTLYGDINVQGEFACYRFNVLTDGTSLLSGLIITNPPERAGVKRF